MRTFPFLALSLVTVLALVKTSCCPQNPVPNTAITAHGNTDWHIDTAQEFLFGTDMGGNPTAANHCPATWQRGHMQVGLTNTAHFYYDKALATPGDDADVTNGIDRAMLFFYAGHGSPTSWSALGNSATQTNMRLGNCPGAGLLRYYWQCSCEVFAHGPDTCAGATFQYACPGDFVGSAFTPDTAAMRNVYQRWGPVLQPDLRMACGASTPAYCHETQANAIWNNYNNNLQDVADSFINGLNYWGVVPLCMTLGGSDVNQTALVKDTRFTNQRNQAGTSYYHIQYLSNFSSVPRFLIVKPLPKQLRLPIFRVEPPPPPERLRDVKFQTKDNFMVSPDEIRNRGPRVRIARASGAVYILGEVKPAASETALKEQDYLDRAHRFIEEQGWSERQVAEPTGVRSMIATAAAKGKEERVQKLQKSVTMVFRRRIDVDGTPVDVLGEGGLIQVQMNSDGTVSSASKVWRRIATVRESVPVKTYEEAYKEALGKIENAQAYKLDHWEWGYREDAGNVEQTEMRIVFRFGFVPVDPKTTMQYPPRMIEIPGQQ